MRHALACVVLIGGLVQGACAVRYFAPPAGPGVPFDAAAATWQTLTQQCRGVRLYVAELRVDGWVGAPNQRVPATLQSAMTRQDDIYLEYPLPGRSGLVMAGRAGQADFLLPRDERKLHAPTRDIVEALTGLKWGAADMLNVLSGCVADSTGVVTGEQFGPQRAAFDLGSQVRAWARQRDGVWTLEAATREGLLVEYLEYFGAFPSLVRISSTSSTVTPLALTFRLNQVQANIDLPPSAFTLTVPAEYTPMTLEDLRVNRPLREGKTFP
jgi:hypothetical protein